MEGYTFLAIKLAIGIIGLVLQINLMGKGNLAPTSAMDQVQNYVLGGIIGAVIYNDNIGIFQFSLVLILWTLLIFTLRFIKNHNRLVKSIIDGRPVCGHSQRQSANWRMYEKRNFSSRFNVQITFGWNL